MILLILINVVLYFHNSIGINIDLSYLSNIDDNITPKNSTYDIENGRKMFEDFVQEHNKQYKDDAEFQRRYEIFVKNLIEINTMNQKSRSEVYGITQFADMTVEEFFEGYTTFANYTSDSDTIYPSEKMLDEVKEPEELDWRTHNVITPARDQLLCNSAWAFTAVACVEAQHAIKHGKLISLSEQQLIDCDNPGGCDRGILPNQALHARKVMGGCMQRSDYPYKGVKGTCAFHKEKAVAHLRASYTVWVRDENVLKNLVYRWGPLVVGIHATLSLKAYKGNIYVPSDSDCPKGAAPNHGVLIVGYGTENGVPYWIMKNSWGQKWGENGFLRLIRGKDACSIKKYIAGAFIL